MSKNVKYNVCCVCARSARLWVPQGGRSAEDKTSGAVQAPVGTVANVWPWAAAKNGLLQQWPSITLFNDLDEENSVPTGTWRLATAIAPGSRPAEAVWARQAPCLR